jgi:hypothetical protein
VIARTRDGRKLIVQSTHNPGQLYLMTPADWQNSDATKAVFLSKTAARQTLATLDAVDLANTNDKKVQDVRQKRKERHDLLVAGVKAMQEGDSSQEAFSSEKVTQLLTNTINMLIRATRQGHDIVDAMIHHITVLNSTKSNTTLLYKSPNKKRSKYQLKNSKILGLCPFDPMDTTVHLDQDDVATSGSNPSAYVVQSSSGEKYRVRPANLSNSILALRQFNVQPRNIGGKRNLRTTTVELNPLLQLQLTDTSLTTLETMRCEGHFDKDLADSDEKASDVVARGTAAIIQKNRFHEQTSKKLIKHELSNLTKQLDQQRKEDRKTLLEMEKKFIIEIVESRLEQILNSKECNAPEHVLDELVKEVKEKASLIWEVFEIYGRAERDDRNIGETYSPEAKDRKILKAICVTIRGGNIQTLPAFALFMAMVRLHGGATYAEIDRMSTEGLCAHSSTVLAFFKKNLPDYTTFKYGSKIDILWDNVNLYIRKKFGSTHDASESKIQNSTVYIIRKHLSDPQNSLSTVPRQPSYQQLAAFISSDPYSLNTTKSGIRLPVGHSYFYLLPQQEQLRLIEEDEDGLMEEAEMSIGRLKVGVANAVLDELMNFLDFANGTGMEQDFHLEQCAELGLVGDLLTKAQNIGKLLTVRHSISAIGYAGKHKDKERVRNTSLQRMDSRVLNCNEMTIDGTGQTMRTIFGRTGLDLSKQAIYDILTGKRDVEMTFRMSGDMGTQQKIEQVLMRCVMGMKSTNFKIAIFCAQIYIMNISSVKRGDPLHEFAIHGAQSIFKLTFGNGLQPIVRATGRKSISPERAKDAAERHGDMLALIHRARCFLVFRALLKNGELKASIVKREGYTYIDPELFMSAFDAHLNNGGESFKHQGRHLVDTVGPFIAVQQSLRHFDTTMLEAYTLHSLPIHAVLGKTYCSLLMKQIEEREFLSPYAKNLLLNETIIALKGSLSSGGTCLGNLIENKGAYAAKQRQSVLHQDLYCANYQFVEGCGDAMHPKHGGGMRGHKKTPKHHKQLVRVVQMFYRSGVAKEGCAQTLEQGVQRLWDVSDSFTQEDVAAQEERKERRKKESSSSSSSETSGSLAGPLHTQEEELQYCSMLTDMNKTNGDDRVWGRETTIPKPPTEKYKPNQRYLGYRESWSTKDGSLRNDKRKLYNRMRHHLIREAIDVLLDNHFKDFDAASSGIPIALLNESLLPEIEVQELSREEKQWYDVAFENVIDSNSTYQPEEYCGE